MKPLKIIGPDDPALIPFDNRIAEYSRHQSVAISLEIIAWPQYRNRLDAVLDGREETDACFIPGHVWLGEYAQKGRLRAFDEVLERSPTGIKEGLEEAISNYDEKDIVSSIAEECRFGEKRYLLPLFTDGHLFFCNKIYLGNIKKILLDDKGLVHPLKLREATRRLEQEFLLDNEKQPPQKYPIALKAHPSELLLDFLPYFWDLGGDFVKEELLDSEKFQTVLQRAIDLYSGIMHSAPPDTKSYANVEIHHMLSRGIVPMAISWGGQAAPIFSDAQHQGIEFSVFPLATSWNATWGIGIASTVETGRAAWVLQQLLTLMDKPLDCLIAEKAGSPIRHSTYANEKINAKCPWLNAQYKMVQHARHLPSDISLAKSLNEISERIMYVFHGDGKNMVT